MKYIYSDIFILPIIYDNETDKRAKNANLLIKIAEGNVNYFHLAKGDFPPTKLKK